MAGSAIPREPRPTHRLPRSRARRRRDPPATRAVSRALGRGVGASPAGAAHPRTGFREAMVWNGGLPRTAAPPAVSRALGLDTGAFPRRARRRQPSPALSDAAPARFPARRRTRPSPARPDAASARSPGEYGALGLGADRDSLRPRRTALFPACSRSAAVAIPAARRPRGLRRSRARRRRDPPEHGAPASPAVALGAGAIPRGHRAPRHLLNARARRRRDPRERGAPRGLCALGLGVGAIPRGHRAPRRFLNARARRRRDPSWARSTPRFPAFMGGRPSLLRPSPSYHRRFCASSPGT